MRNVDFDLLVTFQATSPLTSAIDVKEAMQKFKKEKLDSLLRHHAPWLKDVKTVVVDEVHLINDVERGPTLEVLITILKTLLKDIQIIALSATIGNPKDLADWLNAELIIDKWRPVKLEQGVFLNGEIEFVE